MKANFAMILNFILADPAQTDADFLVKTARNVGARALSYSQQPQGMLEAAVKYTLTITPQAAGKTPTAATVIDYMIAQRQKDEPAIIDIPVNASGQFDAAVKQLLATINNWMHLFGHAFNEGIPCPLKVTTGFVLQNRNFTYQKYIFVQTLPATLTVSGLTEAPNRVELVANRTPVPFKYEANNLILDLPEDPSSLPWQVIRIQEHRPEDDILETKL